MIKTIRLSLTTLRFAFAFLLALWRGHVLPLKAWQAERVKLTAEKSALNDKYQSLKEEIREAYNHTPRKYSVTSLRRKRHGHRDWSCRCFYRTDYRPKLTLCHLETMFAKGGFHH